MAKRKKRPSDSEKMMTDYIHAKKKEACMLVDTIMKELENPDRIANAPLNQLSSVMGTLIDKFSADEKDKSSSQGALDTLFDDFEDVK